MHLIVVDMEFENQSGSQEIIQIGAVHVDLQKGEVYPFFNEYVALPEGMPLSDYITDLTGITEEDLADARSLPEVLEDFWTAFDKAHAGYRLAGWGDDAVWMIEASDRCAVKVPHKTKTVDLKQTFEFFRAQRGLSNKKLTGLAGTIRAFGLTFKGRHHDAYDDALNTGLLLVEAIKNPDPRDH